jgi:hypothetical protein
MDKVVYSSCVISIIHEQNHPQLISAANQTALGLSRRENVWYFSSPTLSHVGERHCKDYPLSSSSPYTKGHSDQVEKKLNHSFNSSFIYKAAESEQKCQLYRKARAIVQFLIVEEKCKHKPQFPELSRTFFLLMEIFEGRLPTSGVSSLFLTFVLNNASLGN